MQAESDELISATEFAAYVKMHTYKVKRKTKRKGSMSFSDRSLPYSEADMIG